MVISAQLPNLIPTNISGCMALQIQVLFSVAVSAYAHQAKETVQIHQTPFSSSGLGAGDETNKIGFSFMCMG